MAITPLGPTSPARAARRQLLRDRFAEYLAEHGANPEHSEGYARDLQQIVDDLGFTLPAGIDDPPPAPGRATREGIDRARALFEEVRAAKTGEIPLPLPNTTPG